MTLLEYKLLIYLKVYLLKQPNEKLMVEPVSVRARLYPADRFPVIAGQARTHAVVGSAPL